MKISIVTVCFNSADTIESTLQSVACQTYSRIEHIIVDGGSSDGTLEIINSFPHVSSCISESDSGIYDAMNKGLALATGDVVCILNSDDFYPNDNVIEEVAQIFESNSEVAIVLGSVDYVDPADLTRPVRFYSSFNFELWKLRFGICAAHPGAFIKLSAYEAVGNYKLGYKISADFEWFVRALLVHRLSYVKLNKYLVRMREGGVSTSGIKSYWVSSNELLRALRDNGIYSNIIFILCRLPVKFYQKFYRD